MQDEQRLCLVFALLLTDSNYQPVYEGCGGREELFCGEGPGVFFPVSFSRAANRTGNAFCVPMFFSPDIRDENS